MYAHTPSHAVVVSSCVLVAENTASAGGACDPRADILDLGVSVRRKLRLGIAHTRASSAVRFLMLLVVIQSMAVMAPNMQWQIRFGEMGTADIRPYMWVGIMLFIAFGAVCGPLVKRAVADARLAMVLVNIGIGIFLAASAQSAWHTAAYLFLAHEVWRGMFEPIESDYLKANTKLSTRATVWSIVSSCHNLGGMIGLPITGLLADKGGITFAWYHAGLFLVYGTIASSLLAVFLTQRKRAH